MDRHELSEFVLAHGYGARQAGRMLEVWETTEQQYFGIPELLAFPFSAFMDDYRVQVITTLVARITEKNGVLNVKKYQQLTPDFIADLEERATVRYRRGFFGKKETFIEERNRIDEMAD